MELGMIGLGRMGGNMAQRLVAGGHRVVTFDRDPEAVTISHGFGGEGASSLEDVVSRLAIPRALWIMIPAGQPTDTNLGATAPGKNSNAFRCGPPDYVDDLLPTLWPDHGPGHNLVDGVTCQALLRQDRAAIHKIGELLVNSGHRHNHQL